MASSTVLSTLCVAQKAGTPTDVLLVADGSCTKIRELLAEALVPVLWLDGDQDPLEAVSAALAQRRRQGQPVQTLHWVSHGSPGVMQVGARAINSANLLANAHNLTQWELSSLALWSCEAGSDRRFIALWEELTGASVWSSSGVLGHLEGGSCDWAVTSSSAIEAPALPVTAAQQQSWTGQLTATSTTTINEFGTVNDVYTSDGTIYVATGGGLSISTNGGATFTNYTTTAGLGSNAVTAVYESGGIIYA
ncbi:DUF4347 domain-containing protein, partial [Synechococcus sp. HK05]|uniref:DUF4347 domain-containing protein n=1 Tax=Synechococcus sp. HK05 TaxID=2725975 RepID=UPI001C387DB6